jgi:hypothetical protein
VPSEMVCRDRLERGRDVASESATHGLANTLISQGRNDVDRGAADVGAAPVAREKLLPLPVKCFCCSVRHVEALQVTTA